MPRVQRRAEFNKEGGDHMLEKADDVKAAAARISEGRLTIWNARLDLAVRVGDVQKVDSLLAHSPVADGGGCDCQCFGGAPFRNMGDPERLVTAAAR